MNYSAGVNYSAGGAKDAVAFVGFIIAFVILRNTQDIRILKPLILVSLLICMFIDGSYTMYPDFHNTPIGYNMPTYLLLACMLAFMLVLTIVYTT